MDVRATCAAATTYGVQICFDKLIWIGQLPLRDSGHVVLSEARDLTASRPFQRNGASPQLPLAPSRSAMTGLRR